MNDSIFRPSLSEDDRISAACYELREHLDRLNGAKYSEVHSHLEAAVTNLIANARYRFIDGNGPKIEKVSEKEPIMYK